MINLIKTTIINREQMKKLEGVLFWRRELKLLNNTANTTQWELERVREYISIKINECDKLNIPFSVQNIVLTYQDVHTDIMDVLQDKGVVTI